MFLINESMRNISIGEAGLIGLTGYLVVFFGLVLLMLVVMITGKIMVASQAKKKAAQNNVKEQEASLAVAAPKDFAPGSAGQIKLYDTNEKDAALIMAIVADKMQKPLNELRFISIREVK